MKYRKIVWSEEKKVARRVRTQQVYNTPTDADGRVRVVGLDTKNRGTRKSRR